MTTFTFFAAGKPETQGSKRQMHHRHTGRIITLDQSPTLKSWRGLVAYECQRAMGNAGAAIVPKGVPVRLDLVFFLVRPKDHFGTGRNSEQLKPSAPTYPTGPPDKEKLARAIGDALSGVAYLDDSQVVTGETQKRYGLRQGVTVTLSTLDP